MSIILEQATEQQLRDRLAKLTADEAIDQWLHETARVGDCDP